MLFLIGVIFTALIAAAVGAGMGYASYNGFYLIVVFPIIMAVVAGVGVGIVGDKTRAPKILIVVFALLVGLAAYGAYRYAEYYFVVQELGKSAPSFVEFLDISASMGTEISRGSSTIELDRNGTLIYWIVEIAGIALMSILFAVGRKNRVPSPAMAK